MTINVNDRRKEYPGNDVATVFTGPRAFSASHIAVYSVDASNASTLLTSGYTLSGVGSANTTITMDVAPAAGTTLLILRTVPYEQACDISNQGAYLPEALEDAGLDPLAQQIQQLADTAGRALRLSDTLIGVSSVIDAVTPLAPVVVNADGTGFEVGDVTLTGDMLLRPNLADGVTPGKGAALVAVNDAATNAVAKTVEDVINGERVSVLRCIPKAQWAAIRAGTSTYDVSGAVRTLIAAMDAAGYGDLYWPAGTYMWGSSVALPSNFTCTGVPGRTWLKPLSATYKPTVDGMFFAANGKSNIGLFGMGFDGDYPNQTQAALPASLIFTNCSYVTVQNCFLTRAKGIAVAFSGCSYSGARSCTLTDNGRYNLISSNLNDRKDSLWFGGGVLATNLLNFAELNSIKDAGLSAVACGIQTCMSVKSNKVNGTGGGGFYLSGCAYPAVVSNSMYGAGGNSIDSYGSYGFNYSGNTITGGTSAAIMAASPIDVATDVVSGAIVGNSCVGNVTAAAGTVHKGEITLHNGTPDKMANVTVDGNLCLNSTGYGFYVVPLGATGTTSRRLGTGIKVSTSNVFAGNALGDVYSLESAFPGSVGQRFYTLAAGATLRLCPATFGNSLALNHVIEIVRRNDSAFGRFVTRGTGAVIELEDPLVKYEITDTGTESAVFYDGAGSILLKNKTAVTREFAVLVRELGMAVQ